MVRVLSWEEIPLEIRFPKKWDQWEAIAIRRGKECEKTIVRSAEKKDAIAKGKLA